MNILFINIQPFYGGGEVYLSYLLKNIDRINNNIYLLTPDIKQFNEIPDIKIIKGIGIPNFSLKLWIKEAKILKEFLKVKKIDIIVFNGDSIRLNLFLPFFKVKKKIGILHFTFKAMSLKGKILAILSMFFLDKLISVSYASVKGLNKFFNKNKISVIYNTIEKSKFELYQKIRNINMKNLINILFVGRIEKEKGIFELIEAIRIISDYIKKIQKQIILNIAGLDNKDTLSKINILIEKYNIKENIKYLGFIDNLAPIYNDSDIFILPSYTEAMPLSVLEAITCGLPVIATNVGGIPEIIENGKEGILIPPKNPQAIADAIIYMIEHPDEYEKMSENAIEKSKKFSKEKFLEEINKVIFN